MDSASRESGAATLYVSYELLSLLSAVYAKLLGCEYLEERRVQWQHNLDRTLEDLEKCFAVWQVHNDELEYGLPHIASTTLWSGSVQLKKRLMRIDRCLHAWVLVRRLPQILVTCEQRFKALVTEMAEAFPLDKNDLSAIGQSAHKRAEILQRLYQHYAQESRSLRL